MFYLITYRTYHYTLNLDNMWIYNRYLNGKNVATVLLPLSFSGMDQQRNVKIYALYIDRDWKSSYFNLNDVLTFVGTRCSHALLGFYCITVSIHMLRSEFHQ